MWAAVGGGGASERKVPIPKEGSDEVCPARPSSQSPNKGRAESMGKPGSTVRARVQLQVPLSR